MRKIKSFFSFSSLIFRILIPFLLKNKILLLFLLHVKMYVFLFEAIFKSLIFFFNFKDLSMIIRSGLLLFNPLILQFKIELSLFIDLEVDIILSYFDLIK